MGDSSLGDGEHLAQVTTLHYGCRLLLLVSPAPQSGGVDVQIAGRSFDQPVVCCEDRQCLGLVG